MRQVTKERPDNDVPSVRFVNLYIYLHRDKATEDSPRNIIRAIRRKKRVLSLHRMFDATADALKWVLARRIKSESQVIYLTREGAPMYRKTKGGNRSQDIPNLWNDLLDKVQVDHPDFRRLPFNSLRDTSTDMIRQIAGEEIASLHSSHKHQSPDRNLKSYSNPRRKRHFQAIRKLERQLLPVFASVADPFPAKQLMIQKAGGENISPAKKAQVIRLFEQGFRKGKIA